MKKVLLLIAFVFITSDFYAKNLNNEKIKVQDFKYVSEVDYEKPFQKFFDVNTQKTIYLVPMKNSNDLLISYLNNDELVPLSFVEENNNLFLCKDLNSRNEVLSLKMNDLGKFEEVNFKEENISFNNNIMRGCLGQSSTMGCVRYAVNACVNDPSCAFMCGATAVYCIGAITASCAISCNTSGPSTGPTQVIK